MKENRGLEKENNFFSVVYRLIEIEFLIIKQVSIIYYSLMLKNYLLLGIGNIGKKYQYTRHNIGFLLIDHLAQHLSEKGSLSFQEKFQSQYIKWKQEEKHIYAIKPSIYVNLSGESLKQWIQFYKIPTSDIVVFVDDYDLPFGKVRLRFSGSSGGHNGLKSIEQFIGKSYCRLRIGIKNDYAGKKTMNEFVLGKFASDELKSLNQLFLLVENFVKDWLSPLSQQELMNKYNSQNFLL